MRLNPFRIFHLFEFFNLFFVGKRYSKVNSGKKVSRRIKASSKVRGYFRASFFPKVARVISNAAARSVILRFFLAISLRRFSYSICGAGNFLPHFLCLFLEKIDYPINFRATNLEIFHELKEHGAPTAKGEF